MITLQQIASENYKWQETQKAEQLDESGETHFGVAGGGDGGGRGGSVLRLLAPGLPVLGDRRLAGLACVIHGCSDFEFPGVPTVRPRLSAVAIRSRGSFTLSSGNSHKRIDAALTSEHLGRPGNSSRRTADDLFTLDPEVAAADVDLRSRDYCSDRKKRIKILDRR